MPRATMVERPIGRFSERVSERTPPPVAETVSVIGEQFAGSQEQQGAVIRACTSRDGTGRTRTGVTYTGATYGFGLAYDQAKEVWDKARFVDGPFARIPWYPCRFKEFGVPIYNESSRANGSRWGGLSGNVGLSEIKDMSTVATGPSLARAMFSMCRLTVFSPPISRDLLADTNVIEPMLDYVAKSEIRYLVDAALIGGNSSLLNTGPNTESPTGILSSPASVPIQRASGGTIGKADIDKLWNSIAGPNKRGATWHCSDETFSTIDEIATTANWPESIYIAAGRYGNEYALLKTRPLIPCEACSLLGTSGDLVIADWGDYAMYYQKYEPNESSLSFNVVPTAEMGQGAWGLPAGAVEARKSEHFLWLNDEVVFLFKARMDGKWRWNQQVKNVNGSYVGPAAFLYG